MRKLVRCFLLLLFLRVPLLALFENRMAGPLGNGLAGAATALPMGVEGVYFNPAALALDPRTAVLTHYRRIFGGLGVGFGQLSLAVQTFWGKWGTWALAYQETGLRLQAHAQGDFEGRVGESMLTLTFAAPLSEELFVGLNLNRLAFRDPRFGETAAFGVDFGVVARFYRVWQMGAFLGNLNTPTLRDDPVPRVLAVGVALIPAPNLATSVDFRKDPDHPARFAVAQQVHLPGDHLAFRGGLAVEGEHLWAAFGLSLRVRTLRFFYNAEFTPQNLPLSHSVGLLFAP